MCFFCHLVLPGVRALGLLQLTPGHVWPVLAVCQDRVCYDRGAAVWLVPRSLRVCLLLCC